ncbi:unnamed protein product [Didymodactylos carnosus]|uniref:Cation efflux protein transmembrane domain-containing protein n=1 Tax=Didymodactylos carnosus TaxID=1234261 RepID=A0A813RUZ9_9BILA|nr:unnamed protein product [Didymodactylos carnosus]CAF0899700.1 unnamed protein product [Didymodactylos carnosus]CAF3571174.1 unnamed protein product [Didymodactylos carnosus]CAF3680653.1 unnamed protein product [Didymodactylos carnosus]
MANHTHNHNHSHKSRLRPTKSCRLATVLLLTIGFFFVELIAGYYVHSVAIVADAIHMLSDSGALVIAIVSVWISKRKSPKNTFGWARAQELGAMVNCILLMSLCFSILVQAIKRLVQAESVDKDRLTLYIVVGVIGLAINILALIILGGDMAHGHSHGGNKKKKEEIVSDNDDLCDDEENHQHSHHHNLNSNLVTSSGSANIKCNHSNANDIEINGATVPLNSIVDADTSESKNKKQGMSGGQLNIRGAFLHVLNDALGSVIVVISGLCMLKWPKTAWVNYIDPGASLCMILLIVIFTIPLLRESALVLLQTVPTHIEVADLQKRLVEQVPGVLAVHEFHVWNTPIISTSFVILEKVALFFQVWQLSGSKIIASAHIRCHNLHEYMRIAEQVKNFFHHEGIHSTTIQPEFINDEVEPSVGNNDCILECLKDCSINTCCGQPSTYVKLRNNRSGRDDIDENPTVNIMVPNINIVGPSRTSSFVE